MVPVEKGEAEKKQKNGSSPPASYTRAIQEAELADRAPNLPAVTGERPSSLTPFQKRVLEVTADTYDAALSALRE